MYFIQVLNRRYHFEAFKITFLSLALTLPISLFGNETTIEGTPLEQLQATIRDLETKDFKEDPKALFTLASIYCNQNAWDSLRPLIIQMQRLPYFKDVTHYFKGRLLLSENKVGSARKEFESALRKRPEAITGLLGHIYFYKAYCLKELNQIDRSKTSFEQALENDFKEENLSELIKLAEFFNLFNRPNDSIAAINRYPNTLLNENYELNAVLGRAYQKLNLHYMAIQSFTQSLDVEQSQYFTRMLRANSYRQIEDLEKALIDIEAAERMKPGQADQQFIHGLILFQMGQLKDAYLRFKEAETAYRSDDYFLVLYGSLSQAIGEEASALSAVETYFEADFNPPNKNAILINLLLNPSLNKDLSFDPYYSDVRLFRMYMLERLSYKEVLSASRDASISYFLAQSEKGRKNLSAHRELLFETLRRSKKKSPEHLFAIWQLNQKEE